MKISFIFILLTVLSTGCVSNSLSYLKTTDDKSFKWKYWEAHQENDILYLQAGGQHRTLSYSYDIEKKEKSYNISVLRTMRHFHFISKVETRENLSLKEYLINPNMYPPRIILFDSDLTDTFLFIENKIDAAPIVYRMKINSKFSHIENKTYHFFSDDNNVVFCYWNKERLAFHKYNLPKKNEQNDQETIKPHDTTSVDFKLVKVYEGKTKEDFIKNKQKYSLPALLVTQGDNPLIFAHEKNNKLVFQEIPVERSGSYKSKKYFPAWSYPILLIGTPVTFAIDAAIGIAIAPVVVPGFVTVNLFEMFARD